MVGVMPVSGALPLLNSVMACAGLVVPTTWPPNASEVGLNPAMGSGALPVPESGSVRV